MKKAQMEIMGLAVIMVLISLGVLFAVKYVFLAPKSDIKEEYSQKNIAQNILYVLLDSDVKCNDNYISIQDLLVDCNGFKSMHCDNEDSCAFAEEEINNIFDKTLRNWNNKFYFNAEEISINEKCPKGSKAGIQPLPYGLEIRLEICD